MSIIERLKLARRVADSAETRHISRKAVPDGAFEAMKLLIIDAFCDDALSGDVGGYWMEAEREAIDPEHAGFHYFRSGYTHVEVADLVMENDPRTKKEILGDRYPIYRDRLAHVIFDYFPLEYKMSHAA